MDPPCFHKHLRAAMAISLFLCVYCSRRYINSFTPALLTVVVLLLSTSFPLLLPMVRVFYKMGSIEKPQVMEVIPPNDEAFQEKDTAQRREDGSRTTAGQLVQQTERIDRSTSDGESSSSDASISDDENLIELELPDGHYVEHKKPRATCRPLPDSRGGFLPCFLPESVFRQRGLKELLSEINEEDNLIEIDIIRGSIKCQRLEIKV